MNRRLFLAALASASAVLAGIAPRRVQAAAEPAPSFTFPSIDGGLLDTAAWRGRPVLVVNTASLCGFAPQLEGMQALHDAYAARGLVVLAVPSDDFAQELENAEKVKEYCTIKYGITLPMTDIVHVTGANAHPFYAWLRQTRGFAPRWNFNKVLLGPDGQVIETWGATTGPQSKSIAAAFTPLLTG